MNRAEELNQKALDTYKQLDDAFLFDEAKVSDEQIRDSENPFNHAFYLSQSDHLNKVYGDLIVAYYNLKAELKTYIAVRKTQIKIENDEKGVKTPGNDVLEDAARAEVSELYKITLFLEGWVTRVENSLRTCRSHTYGTDREQKENEKETRETKDR
jgi:hypothetical protein